MKNQRGIAELLAVTYILGGLLLLLFVPNPVSSSLGMGIKPNKTVYTEKVEFIKDKEGNPIATKTVVDDRDIQQHVTFWEWLRSLPIIVVLLMGLGIVFPPISLVLHNLWSALKADTKKIVVGVDKAMAKVNDPTTKQTIYDEMAKVQDTSTKKLVDKIQGKL